MKPRRTSLIIFSLLILLLASCQREVSRGDSIPSKVKDYIDSLDSLTAPMTELVPQAVTAVTIIQTNAKEDGTVGKTCDAIELVEPKVKQQLELRLSGEVAGDTSTIESLQAMLKQIDKIKDRLGCENLPKLIR
jgi:hypothetical protein